MDTLTEKFGAISAKLYQQAQQAQAQAGAQGAGPDMGAAGAGAGAGAQSGAADDNVVDADYEVVDDDNK